MFGPFPMMEGPCDQKDESATRNTKKSLPKSKTVPANLSFLDLATLDFSSLPPPPPLSEHPAFRERKITPGNAFSLLAVEIDRQRELHPPPAWCPELTSSYEDLLCPRWAWDNKWRRLNYDEPLAIPMPKPPKRRFNNPEKTPPPLARATDEMKVPTFKRRAVDPAPAGDSVSDSQAPQLSKKRSKMDLIKNKLSMRDLHKEVSKPKISPPIPILVPDIPSVPLKTSPELRSPSSGGITPTTPTPTADSLPDKLKPVEFSPDWYSLPTADKPQAKTMSTKNPLPPSPTPSTAQGTMAPMAPVRSASQQIGGPVDRDITPTLKVEVQEKAVAGPEVLTPPPTGTYGPDIEVTRPSSKASSTSTTSLVQAQDHPTIKDSASKSVDRLEGTTEAKYPSLDWAAEADAMLASNALLMPPPSPDLDEGEASADTIPDSVTSFQERLQKANLAVDKFVSKRPETRSTATHYDDVMDMVLSVKWATETGMQNIDERIDELTTWMGEQLKKVLDPVSEGAQELLAKHYELSKEMMKFQMDVRIEIGVMERRLNTFEMHVLDELRSEIRALARAVEAQDDFCFGQGALYDQRLNEVDGRWRLTQRKQMELEVQITELEAQIEEIKTTKIQALERKVAMLQIEAIKAPKDSEIQALERKVAKLEAFINSSDALKSPESGDATASFEWKVSTPVSVKTVKPSASRERSDESTPHRIKAIASQLSVPKQRGARPISPVPTDQASLTQPRVRARSLSKPRIPRSVSLPKKAFGKNTKDAASNTPEKDIERAETPEPTPEDGKKRSPFSFRRRREASDSAGSGSNKFTWATSRRGSATNEGTSSRSSTPPIPPIPRDIPDWVDKTNALTISHPAHRVITAIRHKPDEDNTPAEQKLPLASVTVQPQAHDDGSARGSIPASTTSSLGGKKATVSSLISPDSFHSAQDQHAPESTANNAVDDSARAPLLSDTDQEWDRVSLHESHSHETML